MRVLFSIIITFIMSGSSFIILIYESIKTFKLENGVKTVGIIDTVYKTDNFEGGLYTKYIIKFSPNNTDTLSFENYFKTDDSRYKIGESVEILFNPNDPQQARIDSGIEKYGGVVFLTFFSAISFILGIYILKNPKKIEKLMDAA